MADNLERTTGDKDFEEYRSAKKDTTQLVKDSLLEITKDILKKAGYEESDKPAGVYGTGKEYGHGAGPNKFKVTIAEGPKANSDGEFEGNASFMTKVLQIGAKRLESEVYVTVEGTVASILYRTPEGMFFRGSDENGGTYMTKKKIRIPTDNKSKLKSSIEELIREASEKEVEFITNTKLGVEDKLDAKMYQSMVENEVSKMKLTDIFINENEDEYDDLPDEEEHPDKVKKLNTVPLDSENSGSKKVLFDKEEVDETEQVGEVAKTNFTEFLNGAMNKFGITSLQSADKNKKKALMDYVNEHWHGKKHKTIDERQSEIDEMTTAGPAISGSEGGFRDGAPSGAGGYNTPGAWKPEGELKGEGSEKKSSKDKKQLKSPYNKFAKNTGVYEEDSEGTDIKSKLKETNYYKTSNSQRPNVDRNYNVVPKGKHVSKGPYTETPRVDPDYHTLGMPYIKPNSPEEDAENRKGDPNKLKRMGLSEQYGVKPGLIKRKFVSESDNKRLGINKRYIITERTTVEYEKDRMSTLSQHKLYESIRNIPESEIGDNGEAEKMSHITPDNMAAHNDMKLDYEHEQEIKEIPSDEFEEVNPPTEGLNEKETCEVAKPDSLMGILHKFYKKDFINEEKRYILDLNSLVFVSNPNYHISTTKK